MGPLTSFWKLFPGLCILLTQAGTLAKWCASCTPQILVPCSYMFVFSSTQLISWLFSQISNLTSMCMLIAWGEMQKKIFWTGRKSAASLLYVSIRKGSLLSASCWDSLGTIQVVLLSQKWLFWWCDRKGLTIKTIIAFEGKRRYGNSEQWFLYSAFIWQECLTFPLCIQTSNLEGTVSLPDLCLLWSWVSAHIWGANLVKPMYCTQGRAANAFPVMLFYVFFSLTL